MDLYIIECHGFVAQNIYQFWPEQWDSEPILIQCARFQVLTFHSLGGIMPNQRLS